MAGWQDGTERIGWLAGKTEGIGWLARRDARADWSRTSGKSPHKTNRYETRAFSSSLIDCAREKKAETEQRGPKKGKKARPADGCSKTCCRRDIEINRDGDIEALV